MVQRDEASGKTLHYSERGARRASRGADGDWAEGRFKYLATALRSEKNSRLADRSLNGDSTDDGRSFSLALSERERAGVG